MTSFNILRPTSLILLTLLCIENHHVHADTDSNIGRSKVALQKAISDLELRNKQVPIDSGISFIRTVEDGAGNKLQSKYTPTTQEKGEWKTIEILGEMPSGRLRWNTNFLVSNTNFIIDETTLVRESETTWVFDIPNVVNVDTGEYDSTEETGKKITNTLGASLISEMAVSKVNPRFLSMHIYAPKSFKPSILAKVNTFEVRIDYAEAWEGGPLYTKLESRQLKGKYGFFISIDEFVTTTHTHVVVTQRLSEQNNTKLDSKR